MVVDSSPRDARSLRFDLLFKTCFIPGKLLSLLHLADNLVRFKMDKRTTLSDYIVESSCCRLEAEKL